VPELGSLGTVRGALGDGRPYRERSATGRACAALTNRQILVPGTIKASRSLTSFWSPSTSAMLTRPASFVMFFKITGDPLEPYSSQ